MRRPVPLLAALFVVPSILTGQAAAPPTVYEPYTASAEAKAEYKAAVREAANAGGPKAIGHFDRMLALDTGIGVARIFRAGLKPGLAAAERQEEYAHGIASLSRAPAADVLMGVALREQFAGRTTAASAAYAALVALFPADGDLGFFSSNMQRANRSTSDRAALAREAIARYPDYPVNYRNLGYDLGAMGDYPAGVAAMRDYVKREPNHVNTHESLAELLHRAGQRDEALQVTQRALAMDPSFPSLYALLGDLKLVNGDAAGARNDYGTGIRMARSITDTVDLRHSTALSFLAAGDWRTAQAQLGEVATLAESRNVTAAAILIHQRMAAIDGMYGDGRGIAAHLARAAALGASNTGPQHRHAALAYAGARQVDSARAAAARFAAVATDLNRPNWHEINGYIAVQANDAVTAAAELGQCDPIDMFCRALLADLYGKSGRTADAQKLRDQVKSASSMTLGGRVLDFIVLIGKQRPKATT